MVAISFFLFIFVIFLLIPWSRLYSLKNFFLWIWLNMNISPIDFSIGYQNIEGLHNKTFGCKLPYLQPRLIHDIEVLSEAWGVCDHSRDMPGYQLIPIDSTKKNNVKKGRSSGGILIYCKNYIFKHITKCDKTPQYIWLEIDKNIFHALEEPIKVCIAYNPPANSQYCNKDIYEEISAHIMKYSGTTSKILLIGDFKAIGGGPGVKKHVGLIWKSFNQGFLRFLRNWKSSPWCRDTSFRMSRKWAFSIVKQNFKCDFWEIAQG